MSTNVSSNTANNAEVLSLIYNVLLNNGMLDPSDTYESFNYKVIRANWTPEDEHLKFECLVDAENNVLPESEEEIQRVQEHLLSKECFTTGIPRLVLVNYAEDQTVKLSPGNNQYPPLNYFSQKGMVIDLETSEVLCPGTTWMSTVTDYKEIKVLATDSLIGVRVQRPIEGASVSMFYYPAGKEIFIGTNKRVLKVSKIIAGGGSRWNFYGSGAVENNSSMFALTSPDQLKFDIHRGALSMFLNVALDHLGIAGFECKSNIVEFVTKVLYDVFFAGNENLVYGGILSGRPFANQSKTMEDSDYDDLTLTLNSVSQRTFQPQTETTLWDEEVYETVDGVVYRSEVCKSLSQSLNKFSLDLSKFEVDPQALVRGSSLNPWETPELSDSEDVLFIYDLSHNGQRQIVRYQSPESKFRDFVIRGGSDEEFDEICDFFPRHRNRKFPTPSNIRERVQQVITLSTQGTGHYAFQHVDVLGTAGASELQELVRARMHNLMDARLLDASRHWEDVAYPLSQFSMKPGQQAHTHRYFRSEKNRKVCNGLAVLYACVSEGLKKVVVDEIARYFISRMLIAMTAFLPLRALGSMENSFIHTSGFTGENLPIGVHKIRMICPEPSLSNSQRKYRIAESVANLTYLDIRFAMGFVNFPHQQSVQYTVPLTTY
jgi:hypothetical protein